MSHSYIRSLFHCVYSTKRRLPMLTKELRERLFPYMRGIAERNDLNIIEIGGVDHHVHFLIALPGTIAIAKAVQLIKGGSSKWIHDTFPEHRAFAWQEGYGAFSIGISPKNITIRYIRNQEQHHRKQTFEQEFRLILKKHWIDYDEKYIFG